MADGRADEGRKRVAVEAIADRLSELPDAILQHILSFLPSIYAVRTCVLARRYRDQWKSVPAIRITERDAVRFWAPTALDNFVNCLLLLRNKVPMNEAELNTFEGGDLLDQVECLEAWVRYCVSCKARKIFVSNNAHLFRWFLPKGLFTSASNHLAVLELNRIEWDYDMDFSDCEKLEDLKIEDSVIYGGKIFSPSLKRLRVIACSFDESKRDMDFSDCEKLEDLKIEDYVIYGSKIFSPSLKRLSVIACSFDVDKRARIAVPNLISLLMVDCTEMTPFFEGMPLLVDAFVRLRYSDDCCKNSYEAGDCGDEFCNGCRGINYGKSNCILLEALSSATKLELIALPEEFIFRRDLTQCPIFSKLKTLLLNEWCLTANHGALLCFLQHSPVLKKLVLQYDPNHCYLVEMSASYNLKKQSLMLKDLTLEVKCDEVDDRIHRILEVLCSYGLPVEKIKIKNLPTSSGAQVKKFYGFWSSGSFSFEQKA